MAVLHGKVWPDHEFPKTVFGYHADRNSAHDLGNPFYDLAEIQDRIDRLGLTHDSKVYRLRIVRFELADVTELPVEGQRP